ncbi:hypothetical protein H0X32_01970 [Patescibacteria group bacterium]|nr:hypothetical protein [Patescibacteria group bacterium]
MKISAFYFILGIGFLLIAAVIWWGLHKQVVPLQPVTSTASSTEATNTPSLSGLSIYANGEYGFSIFYSESVKVQNSFDTQYHLPATWRVNALGNATGTSVVSFIGYKVTNAHSYPRYYEVEVRVGISADPKELAACEKPNNGEVALSATPIHGVMWKTFSLQSAGMMQYPKGTSYRIIHDNTCYALEQVAAGSSYRDDPPSSSDIPDTVLTQHYDDLAPIIQSFSFARP